MRLWPNSTPKSLPPKKLVFEHKLAFITLRNVAVVAFALCWLVETHRSSLPTCGCLNQGRSQPWAWGGSSPPQTVD